MTIIERINQILDSHINFVDEAPASIEKMIFVAYMIGMEKGEMQTSELYNAHIAKQHKRAEACRYHKMAAEIVGPETYIYTPNFRGDITSTFGGDAADI